MNIHDRALVIGVGKYADKSRFAPLNGPTRDCEEFVDFLVNKAQVPIVNIEQVVWAPANASAFPTRSDVDLALSNLLFSSRGHTPRRGRRLYLFAAGHCEAPGPTEINVFTAECNKASLAGYPLSKVANSVLFSALYKEIVLFADGCRDPGDSLSPPMLDSLPKASGEEVAQVRLLHGFACSLGMRAYEEILGGHMRGVYSYALIEGLNGKAGDSKGRISSTSLDRFIQTRVSELGGAKNGQAPEMYCPQPFEVF